LADRDVSGVETDGSEFGSADVGRDQMASFLGRALDLEEIIPPPPTTTTTTTTTASKDVTVILQSASFAPHTFSVSTGSEVTFDNSAGGISHDLIWLSGSYPGHSPAATSWTETFTAGTVGTFPCYCSVHGNVALQGMAGTLTVNP
jgi:plastocyanin